MPTNNNQNKVQILKEDFNRATLPHNYKSSHYEWILHEKPKAILTTYGHTLQPTILK